MNEEQDTDTAADTPIERARAAILAIDNIRLRAIAEESLANYAGLLAESVDDIEEAMELACSDQADEGGEIPIIRVSHSLAIDLNNDGITDSVTVSIKHKREAVSLIPDPNQLTLPGLSGAFMKAISRVEVVGAATE